MNLFKVIASGKHSFREEFVSAFFAYLLAPNMDHGLGARFFSSLVQEIGKKTNIADLKRLAQELDDELRTDMFDEDNGQIDIDIEFRYELENGTSGFIDIIARYKNWYFIIENKILQSSKTRNQLLEQYLGAKRKLKELHGDDFVLVQIYLVPALAGTTGWSSSQAFEEELHQQYEGKDFGELLYWQEPEDKKELSVIAMLRNLLDEESIGVISPLSYDTKQGLKSFINFCLNEFSGYNYTKRPQRLSNKQNTDKQRVAELLDQKDDVYIGVQYGKAGLINKAWRNVAFKNELLTVSSTPKGWQYLPLFVFQKMCVWAMNPDNNNLNGIDWQGKPFGTVNLYRVAKTAGKSIFIGMKGGLEKLKRMDEKDFNAKEIWEIGNTQKTTTNWFSGEEFCQTIETKNIRSILDEI
ncbi:MAG: PD-(D/E)XK nuclease family protein [Bacteroidetes bacterium]|nr:PD-(D/E)XK nuclease family protein [Bacteroidota bacterium]